MNRVLKPEIHRLAKMLMQVAPSLHPDTAHGIARRHVEGEELAAWEQVLIRRVLLSREGR